MFCTICTDAKQLSNWTKAGSRNYQHSALKEHATKNKGHLIAVGTLLKQPTIDAASEKALAADNDSSQVQLRTVLFLCKNNLASSTFTALIDLQKANGCPSLMKSDTYKHHESVDDMEEALAQVTRQEIKKSC